ncbi:sugar phosphate isomerase/epimerase [Caldalkalibacillus uzonensis]|uniref:Sugar phosphate isomerase/epimerase n=1 Tax=Caldalkalibacillus uzonensis TaxID=353224 RepID=A0ABU0CSU8_9BACI|nr:sugar phosphate isomerase/epimerase family protein [Caldalkalibacillus uzonensis]MDQ0338565.1 sugar phosphate isomerase/epimerase [Caldalkalibacillus uzonensis]
MKRPFPLGIISDEVSQDLQEVIQFARKFDLDALELRSVNDKVIHQLTHEEIDRIDQQVKAAGLRICALSTPLFKCELSEKEVGEHLEMLHRIAEIAQHLQARIIRGFSFWSRKEVDWSRAFDRIIRHFERVVPVLEKYGLIMALEFDPAVYAHNARKVRKIIDSIDSPHIQGLYDPGNDIWDPEGEIPFPDGYEHLANKICHIHLKDAVKSPEGVQAVAIGKGEVDYRGLFKRLQADRYKGYLVVETHYRLKSKLTEEQLKRPSGNSFSEGGYEASTECVQSLDQLLAEVV